VLCRGTSPRALYVRFNNNHLSECWIPKSVILPRTQIRLYRQIQAAKMLALLPTGNVVPNERQARELVPLVMSDPDGAVKLLSDLQAARSDRGILRENSLIAPLNGS
jgi:hypothetical protein